MSEGAPGPSVAAQRLVNHRLAGEKLQTPSDVVAWFGAVQAQEYGYSKWALGLRLANATDDTVEQAFTEGSILRTHAIRPTWHFVTPADIRWVLSLTAARVRTLFARTYRELDLDETLLARSNAVIASALEGGRFLTRAELAAALGQAGIVASGRRLRYILHRAETDAVMCSGPRRGKQFTYALLEERAPRARTLPRDEALAELGRRYFTSHGPATVQDFTWWSGLTAGDCRASLEMNRPYLAPDEVGGKTYWRPVTSPLAEKNPPLAHLLPPYDEYVVAYRDRRDIFNPGFAASVRTDILSLPLIIAGQVVGQWKYALRDGATLVETSRFRPFTEEEGAAVSAAVERFGAFLGRPVGLVAPPGAD
jgi:hypothetical protein